MQRRRQFLKTAALGAAGLAFAPLSLASVPTERRLVLVLLRGGLDGLHAVAPYADKDYRRLRPRLALPAPGEENGVIDLDGYFGLHPSLSPLASLYRQGELLIAPAATTVYRNRSHFDGQNLLENGSNRPFGEKSGWLNRALTALNRSAADDRRLGLALGPNPPLVLQGEQPVATWAESPLPEADDEFLFRLAKTYAHDPLFAATLAKADNSMVPRDEDRPKGRNKALERSAQVAADFLARPSGPRLAVIEAGGWDTHFRQSARLRQQFSQLSAAFEALRRGLGDHWRQTTVLVVSEFGRTAAENGSEGTDHGVGGLALLAGGAVRGGRILDPWPGLTERALYEGRDLRPTLAYESLFKGVLLEGFGLSESTLEEQVFPNSRPLNALTGLLRS